MINKELIDLCTKRSALLKHNEKSKLSNEEIEKAESDLNVILAKDFRILCNFYGYDYFNWIEFYSFPLGVIHYTLELRKLYNLPHNYLVLAEDDAGPILLKTISSESSEVLLCSNKDLMDICNNRPCTENPIIFHSFTEFYAFLLDEEDKSMEEDALLEQQRH